MNCITSGSKFLLLSEFDYLYKRIILTSSSHFINRSVRLPRVVSGNIISQANSCKGNEAIVERIQVVPFRFHGVKDSRWH